MKKLVSRVAIFRSEESRLEGLADPSKLAGLDENDPKSVARWMKKMGKEMGEDMGEGFEAGDRPGRRGSRGRRRRGGGRRRRRGRTRHLILCVLGKRPQEVHYELKHKRGVIARAGNDDILAKNKKE